jgi:hypothetical protein
MDGSIERAGPAGAVVHPAQSGGKAPARDSYAQDCVPPSSREQITGRRQRLGDRTRIWGAHLMVSSRWFVHWPPDRRVIDPCSAPVLSVP